MRLTKFNSGESTRRWVIALILGLDPGSQWTGYGLIETRGEQYRYVAHGVITLSLSQSFAHRLSQLDRELEILLQKYPVDFAIVEKIFLGKSADSAFKLGHARGVCLMRARHEGSEIFEYEARRVKKIVTGSGAATKEQVRLAVQSLLQMNFTGKSDATDALSLALCHLREMNRLSVEEKLREMDV